jgi:hypothetical protein
MIRSYRVEVRTRR